MAGFAVVDVETTGLSPANDRIIEIGVVTLDARGEFEGEWSSLINPHRPVTAQFVHGISDDDVATAPSFSSLLPSVAALLEDRAVVAHNAAFDVGFLNAELALLDMAPVDTVCHAICDTLRMAKELYPGKKNNLNALCERYGVDNSHRTLHGALLDAEILAEVYLAMTRGQESLIIDLGDDHSGGIEAARRTSCSSQARTQIVRRASPEELAEHEQVLAAVEQASKGQCLWLHTGTGR